MMPSPGAAWAWSPTQATREVSNRKKKIESKRRLKKEREREKERERGREKERERERKREREGEREIRCSTHRFDPTFDMGIRRWALGLLVC